MQLLQREHNARQRRAEGSRKPGARAAGHQQLFLGPEAVIDTRKPLAHHRAQLNARTLASQRQTAADGADSA